MPVSSSSSPMSPDAFEKSLSNTESRMPCSKASTISSNDDWYLNKRSSRGSHNSRSSASTQSSSKPPRAAVTPLPPSIEVPLAILTGGLSVAAYHSIKSISERRAAKKIAAHVQEVNFSREESILVPSTMPEPTGFSPAELPTPTPFIAELDASPQALPPAYSEKPQLVPQEKF